MPDIKLPDGSIARFPEATAFQKGFDSLPAGAQTQIYAYLAVPGGSWARADDATVKTFARTPEGAELVREWGVRADRNVATVRGRIGVMMKSMAPEDRRAAEAWFDGLPAAHAKALMKALVR